MPGVPRPVATLQYTHFLQRTQPEVLQADMSLMEIVRMCMGSRVQGLETLCLDMNDEDLF